MIKGKKKTELTAEEVLNRVSEYDIYRYYLNSKWKLNEITNSPFREDLHPSFLIGNKKGHISHIDFADTSKRGNCFDFVKQLYNLPTFNDVLRTIDRNFGLGISGGEIKDYKKIVLSYKQPQVEKRYSLIQVITRKFTKEELNYWNLYHQDLQDLRDNNIYSIKTLYFNKSKFPLKETELRFAYLYEGKHFKIYRPFADKKNKWVPNNVPITTLEGKENIINCNTALISKSKKDLMVIKKVFPHVCAVQNEGIACFSEENVRFLKENSDKQILAFDSDVVGVSNSQQITKLFDFGYCNVPKEYLKEEIKDFADLAKTHGLKKIEDYFKQKQLI